MTAAPLAKPEKAGRQAFADMCRFGGVSLPAMLARRFELLGNRTALLPPRFSDLDATALDNLTDEQLRAEHEAFGPGPPIEATEEQRLAWFQRVWDAAQGPAGEGGGGNDSFSFTDEGFS